MKILALESSCDETSAAVVEKKDDSISVLSSVTATSLELHAATGGIIPENAARMQVKYVLPVVLEALRTADNTKESFEFLKNDVDSIAVTYGPGLIGSLLVGVETAKTLAYVFDKPLIPVNHLLAHIYANFLPSIKHQSPVTNFPFIGLIVSGGHTDLLLFRSHGDYEWLGGTRDDAAGEAFDKIGRILGLPYPAGPEIERRASLVSKTDVRFKSPIIGEDNFDFSFSGLKTQAARTISNENAINRKRTDEICFATQKAILDVLVKKTLKAAEKYNCASILVGGGVSANSAFREQLKTKGEDLGITIHFPEKQYSTDNGAMIGAYALINSDSKNWKEISANPELYFA